MAAAAAPIAAIAEVARQPACAPQGFERNSGANLDRELAAERPHDARQPAEAKLFARLRLGQRGTVDPGEYREFLLRKAHLQAEIPEDGSDVERFLAGAKSSAHRRLLRPFGRRNSSREEFLRLFGRHNCFRR
jgi:hypothetical protein